jgi:hypothetical protein
MNDQKLIDKYLDQGIEICTNGNPEKIYKLKLPFTSDEWMDLMDTEGKSLGACCAVISDVRDTLMATLRERGWIRATDLKEIVDALKEHREVHSSSSEPQAVMARIWEAIKEDVDLFNIAARPHDPNDLNDAFSILNRSAANLSWDNLFTRSTPESENKHTLLQMTHFARLVPTIKTIYDHLVKNGMEPVFGFAVAEGEKIVPLRNEGFAIFPTVEEAKEILDYLNQEESRFSIRNVKVSLEEGVVFL